MRKTIRALLGAAAAVAALTLSAQASELQVMWNLDSDKEEQVLRDLLARYTAAHPETTFKIQIVPYDSYDAKLAQVAAGGAPPDIAKTTSMRPVIRPFLTDLVPTLGPDMLKPYVASWAVGASLGDKVIAMPFVTTATGIFLNKDAFAKAGVPIPSEDKAWTWDEFLPKVKEVSEKAGIRFPLVWDVTAGRWIPFLFQHGQHVFTEQAPYQVVLDPAKGATVLDKFVEVTEAYMPPGLWKGSSAENPKQLFLTGQAVAWMSGSWQVASLVQSAAFQWQAGPTPYGTVRSSVTGGSYIIGFQTSAHPDEAAEVIKWLGTSEAQVAFVKPLMQIPARTDTGAIDYGDPRASAALQVLQDELAKSPVYAGSDQANPAMQYVWDPLKQNILQTVAGQIDATQAMTRVKEAAEKGLASPDQ